MSNAARIPPSLVTPTGMNVTCRCRAVAYNSPMTMAAPALAGFHRMATFWAVGVDSTRKSSCSNRVAYAQHDDRDAGRRVRRGKGRRGADRHDDVHRTLNQVCRVGFKLPNTDRARAGDSPC